MRAVIVDDYGARPRLAGLPNPEVHAGQILIRADADGINPMDRAIAAGDWQTRTPGKFPMVLGADVAGTVEQLGEGSKRLSVGEKVFGQLLTVPLGSTGTYAEYVAVNENSLLTRVPAGLDATIAASAPTAGMTGLSIVQALTGRR